MPSGDLPVAEFAFPGALRDQLVAAIVAGGKTSVQVMRLGDVAGVRGSANGCGVVLVTHVMVKTVGVEFFCYHRDRPGSVTLREELLEQHWSYMDRYQAEMIARDELIAYGPLLSDNAATWLGTAALVRAQDPGAARAILTPDRYAGIEVHDWQFGGRPS
jgi:hypothetical protein